MSRRITDQATEVLSPAAYLTPEWYEARRHTVSASEIAAILGLSPYASPFDLWWQKRTGTDSQGDTRDTLRGRRYERLIIEDFTTEHPEFAVDLTGLCVNNERPWQTCTPDGVVHESTGAGDDRRIHEPVGVVEAKTAAQRDEWGDKGTDAIPVAYRCQVLWQMDCLGLTAAFVPVLFGFDYREYVVGYDETDVALMREAASNFLDSLAADHAPDVDRHTATVRRLKMLHPDLEDTEVVVPDDVADDYAAACAALKAAKADKDWAETRLLEAIGRGRWALRADGTKVATRSVYDVAERVQKVRAHTINKLIPPRKPKQPAGTTVKEAVTT